ncbi:MAG: hypothetical protein M1118_01375 [Chloroflexi bacterium]|nr:hypothetical protein [Chloroflexota bacterium]
MIVTGFVAGAAADEVEAVFALAVEEAVWLEVVVAAEGLALVAGELVTPQAVKAALASPEAASADMRRTIARRGVLTILNEFRLEL